MIAIINTGKKHPKKGHHYRLQINDQLITEFWHHRVDGLSYCLHRAAEAAEAAHQQRIETLLQLINGQ